MPAEQPLAALETETACAPLEQLAGDFVDRLRAGEHPSIANYQERHPAHAAGIAELFPTIAALEGLRADDTRLAGGPPAKLGEFRILRELGRGGMGVVYLAEQPSLARKVALKVLPAAAAPDSSSRLRFQREARLAAGLSHPCITPVFAVGEGDGMPWFAMQLLQGVGLDQVIAALAAGATVSAGSGGFAGLVRRMRDGVPVLRAREDWQDQAWLQRAIARLIAQAAEALHHAHQHGVLHRDVKPANLILDIEGRIFVNDFGLAKAVGEVELTTQDSITGTLLYLAPERFDGVADRRCDVYSLGLVLYELLARRRAFAHETRSQLVKAIVMDGAAPLRYHAPGVAAALAGIVDRACARAPQRRHADALSLARDLQAFADSPLGDVPADGAGPPRSAGGPPAPARRWPQASLLLIVALLGASVLLRSMAAPDAAHPSSASASRAGGDAAAPPVAGAPAGAPRSSAGEAPPRAEALLPQRGGPIDQPASDPAPAVAGSAAQADPAPALPIALPLPAAPAPIAPAPPADLLRPAAPPPPAPARDRAADQPRRPPVRSGPLAPPSPPPRDAGPADPLPPGPPADGAADQPRYGPPPGGFPAPGGGAPPRGPGPGGPGPGGPGPGRHP